MLTNVIDALKEAPNSLDTLKQLLSQLVLPVLPDDVLPLVLPDIYMDVVTTRELIQSISALMNCLSPHLIQFLCEESQCLSVVVAVKEFIAIRDNYAKSILCIQEACSCEPSDCDNDAVSNSISPGLFKAHMLDLTTLQSPQPQIFLKLNNQEEQLSESLHTFRLSVEVNRPFLTLSDYDNITNAVSTAFLLPNLALVYAGCSAAPLVVTWLVPVQLLPYLESPTIGSTASGDRLLAEQGVVAVAIGEESSIKCLRWKVCIEFTLLCSNDR